MRGWWNHGVHERALSMYCFLVQFNIPEREGLIRAKMWQMHIHEKLGHIQMRYCPGNREVMRRERRV